MKERLLEKFRRLAESRPALDPGVFSDPLAGQTGWSPLKSGWTNFTTHRLVREGDRQNNVVKDVLAKSGYDQLDRRIEIGIISASSSAGGY